MIDKTVKVNLGLHVLPTIIECTEGDTMWRWHFEVYYDSQRWTIPSGSFAFFTGRKADGNVFDMLESVENNEAVVVCDAQMTAAAGPVACVLRIIDADGKTVASTPVVLAVKPNPQTQGPMSETVLSAYNEVLQEISGAIGGTTNYNDLKNLPSINGATLQGNKTAEELGLAASDDVAMIDVAHFASGALSSSNIAAAVVAALTAGHTKLYIPDGQYVMNLELTQDCELYFAPAAVIHTESAAPCIKATGCAVKISGGTFYVGTNDDSRSYAYHSSGAEQGGLIEFYNCTGICVDGITCTHSKCPSVVQVKNCSNVKIENSSFSNCLLSAVHILEHCEDVVVRGCSFVNMRYSYEKYYCYAVFTGLEHLTDLNVIPPDRLTYENNYVNGSEDSALDTHGATNVVIRNNRILNAVCSITAYNDDGRVVRPSGWTMENVLIENNYCESNRSNNANTSWPHPFVLLGSSNYKPPYATFEDLTEAVTSPSFYSVYAVGTAAPYTFYHWTGSEWQNKGDVIYNEPGSFDSFKNCTVRNNTFIKETRADDDARILSLNSISRNVIIENNLFHSLSGKSPFRGTRSIGLVVKNNHFINCANVVFQQSTATDENNTGMRGDFNLSALSHVYGSNAELGKVLGNVIAPGDVLRLNDGTFFSCVSFGRAYIPSKYTGSVSQTITVTDGIAKTQEPHGLIPGLALYLFSDGQRQEAFCYDVLDVCRFFVRDRSLNNIPDGTYTATLIEPTLLKLEDKAIFTGTATGAPATFSCGANGEPLEALSVDLPYSATPYDSLTVERAGENTYQYSEILPYNSNASASSLDGGTGFRVTSVTDGTYRCVKRDVPLLAGKTITISADVVVNSGMAVIALRRKSNSVIYRDVSSVQSGRLTLTVNLTSSDASDLRICFFCTFKTSEAGDVEYRNVRIDYGREVLNVAFNDVADCYGGSLDVINGVLTVTKAEDGSDLATAKTYQLLPANLNTVLGENSIWSNAGDVSVIYRADPTLYVASQGGGAGENGATFTPSVSAAGVISWTNDKGLENPAPVNIKGPQGIQGETGPQGPAYTLTAEDKAEIVSAVIADLPVYNGGVT